VPERITVVNLYPVGAVFPMRPLKCRGEKQGINLLADFSISGVCGSMFFISLHIIKKQE
jgi:hypothetical protein